MSQDNLHKVRRKAQERRKGKRNPESKYFDFTLSGAPWRAHRWFCKHDSEEAANQQTARRLERGLKEKFPTKEIRYGNPER